MAIRAVRTEGADTSYPRLMAYPTGSVILFTEKTVGMCVQGDDITPTGHHSFNWGSINELVDFTGSVTLSNEG